MSSWFIYKGYTRMHSQQSINFLHVVKKICSNDSGHIQKQVSVFSSHWQTREFYVMPKLLNKCNIFRYSMLVRGTAYTNRILTEHIFIYIYIRLLLSIYNSYFIWQVYITTVSVLTYCINVADSAEIVAGSDWHHLSYTIKILYCKTTIFRYP